MKFLEFKKIRSRLVFWFLLTSFIPLLVAMIIFYTDRQRVNRMNTFEKLVSIRELKVNQLNEWIDERIGDMHVMANDYELEGLEKILATETQSNEDDEKIRIAEESLKRSLNNYPDYSNISIISTNSGQIKISTNEELRGKSRSQELYFTSPVQTGDLYISQIIRSKKTGEPEMYFSVPVYSKANKIKPIGILVAQINLNVSLYKLLLNRVGLGKTGETLIVNKNAIALNELRWYSNAPLRLRITAKPAVNAANGETGILKTKDYRGVKVLAAYSFIPRTGWGLICKQDTKELNEPLQKATLLFFIILALAGVVIIIITIRFSKSISNPIVQMNEIAQKMRLGDFSQRNEIHSFDELGLLEMEFNNMADEIESRIKIQNRIHKISEIMLKQNEMKEFSTNLLKRLMKISNANMGIFYILSKTKSVYEPYSSIGANEEMLKTFDVSNPAGEIAKAIFFKKISHLRDISEETVFKYKTVAGDVIPKEIITIPVVVDNIVVALISLVTVSRFSKECIEVFEQSHIGINTSYSNILAGEKTRILSEQLTIINQQLEQQTEELQDQAEELQDQASELRNTTQELQKQNILLDIQRKQVEEANKLKSEFLSNMSHELRTPLNSIMALSKVLLQQAKTKLDDEENNYLEIIERNGRRLLTIINDILDLSKIEAGKMDIVPQKVSVSSLLITTAENLQTLAEEKKLKLEVKIPKPLPPVITDEFRLHQVLTNIVGNAIKFTETGEVVISATYDLEFIKIIVKDTGIGISEDMMDNIFDEFRQVDGSISRHYEGTGLGLAIAKKIILILGGNITVKSELGIGSEFTIHLPLREKFDEENGNSSETKEIAFENELFSKKSDTNRKTTKKNDIQILLVEDNPDIVLQMKNILVNKGYSVVAAENGIEALKHIKDSHPAGIILDLMMPKMNGFEFLEKLRSNKETMQIPVLILTAKDLNGEEIDKLKDFNIHSFIRKGDVDKNNLFSKIEAMLKENVKIKSEKNTNQKDKNKSGKIENVDVLVVEDNLDNLITIKALLGGDYDLREAVSGEEGLQLVDEKKPDLILLDMSLPEINGKQFLSHIRENAEFSNIPVIVVTAQAMKGDKEKFLEYGFDGYVAKPIDAEKLKEEIKSVLK